MYFEYAILIAYAITIISEITIILFIQRPQNVLVWIVGIILINSLTHPLAMYFFHVKNFPYILTEISVAMIEVIWYKIAFMISWKRSVAISIVANLFSILVGILLRFILNI